MAKPNPVKGVLGLLADRTRCFERPAHGFTERLGDLINRRVLPDSH